MSKEKLFLTSLGSKPELQKSLHDALVSWEAFSKIYQSNKRVFNVVISGQQNSGKSTLGNALIGSYDKEFFKTSDVICTKKNTYSNVQDGICFIDTPGFGSVDDGDDEECRISWKKADLILFVHSVLLGGADQSEEIAMLNEIKQIIPNPSDRVLLLCSKCGGLDKKTISIVSSSFKSKVTELFGKECSLINIDSHDYIDGMLESPRDNTLIEISNIEKIKKWIFERKNLGSIQNHIFNLEKQKILSILFECRSEVINLIETISYDQEKYESRLRHAWQQAKKELHSAWKLCVINKV